MASAEWLKKIGDAVVTAMLAYADLAYNATTSPNGLLKKIEQGIVDPIRQQEILGHEVPYGGVSARAFTPHEGDWPTGQVAYKVSLRVDIATVASLQVTAEQKVRDILATIALFVALEMNDSKFSLDDEDGYIDDVEVGSGEIKEALVSEDETSFMVIGEYTFTVLYMLRSA